MCTCLICVSYYVEVRMCMEKCTVSNYAHLCKLPKFVLGKQIRTPVCGGFILFFFRTNVDNFLHTFVL